MKRKTPLVSTLVTLLLRVTYGYSGFNGGTLSSTLATFHQHVCDGQTLDMRCPHKTIISVQFAQYGRQVPSSQMCPSLSKTSKRFQSFYSSFSHIREDTNCQATTSLQVLLDLCQHKHHCHLVASAETFRQDPCPGTSKYLEVAYKCHPAGYKNEVVCEGDQMVLRCKRSTRVAIYSAMFGRIPNGTNKCPPVQQGYIDCKARPALEEVRKRCHGRKRCVIEAEEYVFGNPCPTGIYKYLNVTYACVPKRILKAVHRKEGKGHRRKKKKDRKKSGTLGDHTKYIPKPSTPAYSSFQKTATQQPEKASADAADLEEKRDNIVTPRKGNNIIPSQKESTEEKPTPEVKTEVKSEGKPNRNFTIVCVNYTTIAVGSQQERSMGFVKDWFNAWYFFSKNKEKAILYLVLGVCFGIITMLTVVLIKIGSDYKRNIRAKLDVTEPTHSHNATSNHHNPLEGPSLQHAESVDRIEVVRFSPRGTLRSDPGNRSLSNYYG